MTDETPPPPPDPGKLQFDRVESTQPIVAACSACHAPLGERYYALGTAKICSRCRDGALGRVATGSAWGRRIKAALLGLFAAVVGGSIWAIITYKSEGSVYGIVAIGLGYLVGLAVRKGSGARGGRGYQALAIGLTYLGVAIGYFGAAIPELGKAKASQTTREKTPKPKAEDAPPREEAAPPAKADPSPIGYLLGLLLVAGVCLGSPILVGMESPLTLLFLGIALWEAWKLNRGVGSQLQGPFRTGSGRAGG